MKNQESPTRRTIVATPANAAKLLPSFSSIGYQPEEALAEFLDNALEHGATKIFVETHNHPTVEPSTDHPSKGKSAGLEIIIADNGEGMSLETLQQAMCWGSLTPHEENSLGKFGLGFKTAANTIADVLYVVTRDDTGAAYVACHDAELVAQENAFCVILETASKTDEELLDRFVKPGNSGTVFVLQRCVRSKVSQAGSLATRLEKHFGRIYRRFLIAPSAHITVNESPVAAIDPLERSDSPKVLFDDHIEIEGAHVKVTLVSISDSATTDREIKKGMSNQGFYVLRNQREIVAAETLGLPCYTRHNDFNRLRGEIEITEDHDDKFGIEFTKQRVVLAQNVRDILDYHLGPHIRKYRKDVEAERSAKESPDIESLHSQAMEVIKQRSKLLEKAPVQKNERSPRSNRSEARQNSEREGGEHRNLSRPALSRKDLKVDFKAERKGDGPIFECYPEGSTIVVIYNIDHPFYRYFIANNATSNRQMVTAVDFLIFALANAELRESDDDNRDMMYSIRANYSTNMRLLLS